MRPVAFYRVMTDSINPQFGIRTEQKGEVDTPYFMHHVQTVPDPADPELAHLRMLIARAPDAALLPSERYVGRYSYSSRRKPVEAKKIPDLWTRGGIDIASERFLDVIGDEGRDCLEIKPFSLYDFASGMRLKIQFYWIVVRHVAQIEPLPDGIREEICDAKMLVPDELNALNRIVSKPPVQSFLERIPLWTLFAYQSAILMSPELGKKILKSKLVGFKELKPSQLLGDVSHVWSSIPRTAS